MTPSPHAQQQQQRPQSAYTKTATTSTTSNHQHVNVQSSSTSSSPRLDTHVRRPSCRTHFGSIAPNKNVDCLIVSLTIVRNAEAKNPYGLHFEPYTLSRVATDTCIRHRSMTWTHDLGLITLDSCPWNHDLGLMPLVSCPWSHALGLMPLDSCPWTHALGWSLRCCVEFKRGLGRRGCG